MKLLYISIPLDRIEAMDRLRPFLEDLGRWWALGTHRVSSTYSLTYVDETDRLEVLWSVVRERAPSEPARTAIIHSRGDQDGDELQTPHHDEGSTIGLGL